jgi:hypothetical protein
MTDNAEQSGEASQRTVDAVRQEASKRLASQASSGGMTLDEYAERAIAIEQAATQDEIESVVHRLDEEASEQLRVGKPRWLVGIFGGAQQGGRWRLSNKLRIVAVLGGVSLNLGSAQPEAPESTITAFAFMGGADIVAPPGVSIQMSGLSLLGGKSDERAAGPPLPGAPLIHLRVFTLLGGVKLSDRSPGPG